MTDTQLTRLRYLESELLHLRHQLEQAQARVYELHQTTVEMLLSELASPLT